ncbi:MAG TPA: hypothetical protein VH196_11135, partial [Terriglobales bacterium]|nr:hypothetical protein [Terriglobales bacterium]
MIPTSKGLTGTRSRLDLEHRRDDPDFVSGSIRDYPDLDSGSVRDYPEPLSGSVRDSPAFHFVTGASFSIMEHQQLSRYYTATTVSTVMSRLYRRSMWKTVSAQRLF